MGLKEEVRGVEGGLERKEQETRCRVDRPAAWKLCTAEDIDGDQDLAPGGGGSSFVPCGSAVEAALVDLPFEAVVGGSAVRKIWLHPGAADSSAFEAVLSAMLTAPTARPGGKAQVARGKVAD